MTQQRQFLQVVSMEEAVSRFETQLDLVPLGEESVDVSRSLGRTLSENVRSDYNIPNFDRSNFDGFAVVAHDTEGATELTPVKLQQVDSAISAGDSRELVISSGETIGIATGGRLPRGANAVVLVEDTTIEDEYVRIDKAVAPGSGVSFTASDISMGQVVLWQGSRVTSRETGVLAAIGKTEIKVFRRPHVAVISTGDELIPPGKPLGPSRVFDSNARILCDAIAECGGTAVEYGIAIDDLNQLNPLVDQAIRECDVVVLSGGTSKGDGDLSYQSIRRFQDPGIVVHGVALKPGKPVCLAVTQGKPLIVLPGFPTSAVFTFHQFVAPVIRAFAGIASKERPTVRAQLSQKINSAIGRTEYNLVGLAPQFLGDPNKIVAYPIGKGSGSVTAYKLADGFFSIDATCEQVDANAEIEVQLLSQEVPLVDLVFAGSHCAGVDHLVGCLQQKTFNCKTFFVGSTAGLQNVQRGQALIAGIHLLDEKSGQYNRPFLDSDMELLEGYVRQQGIVFRSDDERFADRSVDELQQILIAENTLVMANRNPGSGTRILLDRLLKGAKPTGYWNCASNHYAAVASVHEKRADWTVAISAVSNQLSDLTFVPLAAEHFDFVIAKKKY